MILLLSGTEGDWFFAPALFGEDWARELPQFEGPVVMAHHLSMPTADFERELVVARQKVDGYLDRCLEETDWHKYEIIGFSTTFPQTFSSLALARKIKAEFPDLSVVLGGANCDGEMGIEIAQFPLP